LHLAEKVVGLILRPSKTLLWDDKNSGGANSLFYKECIFAKGNFAIIAVL